MAAVASSPRRAHSLHCRVPVFHIAQSASFDAYIHCETCGRMWLLLMDTSDPPNETGDAVESDAQVASGRGVETSSVP